MTDTSSYKRRVWRGDPKTVEEARKAYQIDPLKGLIPFAVALYSFRHRRKFAEEMIDLRHRIVSRADGFLMRNARRLPSEVLAMSVEERQKLADLADVLSTHLEWISRQYRVPEDECRIELDLAEQVCEEGIRFCVRNGEQARMHTYCLLRLTEAQIYMRKKRALVSDALASARWGAGKIADPNQKARVYRKLGMLLRKRGDRDLGLRFGTKACFVPASTMAVRLKSLAALCGVEQ